MDQKHLSCLSSSVEHPQKKRTIHDVSPQNAYFVVKNQRVERYGITFPPRTLAFPPLRPFESRYFNQRKRGGASDDWRKRGTPGSFPLPHHSFGSLMAWIERIPVFRLSLTQPGEKRENGDVEQTKNSEDSSCDVIDKVLRYL
jgi:hypothetical protein